MGESGDLINEFKGAKPPEKAVIVLGVIAVAGTAIYLYMRSQSSSSNGSVIANTGTPATGPNGQVAGYPTVGSANTPVLPNGVNPVYDPNGNLVAFQNPPTTNPTTTPTPTPTPTTNLSPLWYTNILGKLGYGSKVSAGGVDPIQGQRFWTSKNSFFYAPVGSSISSGPQGRVWLQIPGQQHQLLTGPGLNTSNTAVATTASGSNH